MRNRGWSSVVGSLLTLLVAACGSADDRPTLRSPIENEATGGSGTGGSPGAGSDTGGALNGEATGGEGGSSAQVDVSSSGGASSSGAAGAGGGSTGGGSGNASDGSGGVATDFGGNGGSSGNAGSGAGGNAGAGGADTTGVASGGAGGAVAGSGGVGGSGGSAGSGGGEFNPVFPGYEVPDDPNPTLPDDGELDVLIVAGISVQPASVATDLQQALLARDEYTQVRVDAYTLPNYEGLLPFYFGWTDRDARLALLDDGYDYIVFADTYEAPGMAPQGHFASILELANLTRTLGATPILMMTEHASPLPNEYGELCSNTCVWSSGGTCHDGGFGANGVPACDLGTDCDDCGVRTEADRQHSASEERFWRTAIGTGCVPVAAGSIMGELEIAWADRAAMFLAALYTAFTEESITTWAGWSDTSPWPERADAVLARYQVDQTSVHYVGPRTDQVRIEPVDPGMVYHFLTSGTSSEAGYASAMQALLTREGYTPDHTGVGSCNSTRTVDDECMQRVANEMQEADYISLYARFYTVSRSQIHAASGSTLLQPQVYDRHVDSASNDGASSLDNIWWRTWSPSANARTQDLAWLPQHINFGKYKIETGGDLLVDGVHATSAVQAGLAAMSYVSRTGLSPTTEGVSANEAAAIRLGEHTIRTLTTYSRTGIHIPDTSENRLSLH